MSPNPHEIADLVTFTEAILNGKPHILCSEVRGDHFAGKKLQRLAVWGKRLMT